MDQDHTHPQTKVKFKELSRKVDKLLAPLVLELFEANLQIWDCCQGYQDRGSPSEELEVYRDFNGTLFPHIVLPVHDADKFLEIILTDFSESKEGFSLYKRIIAFRNTYPMGDKVSKISKKELENTWKIETKMHDVGEDYQAMILPVTTLFFPQSDLAYLTKKLQEYNELEPEDEDEVFTDEHDDCCDNCGEPLEDEFFDNENTPDENDLDEGLELITANSLKKLKSVFEKLNDKNIYADLEALDDLFEGSSNQDLIDAMEDTDTLRGGIFWDSQPFNDKYPVLHLGFLGRNQDSWEARKKAILEIAKDVSQTLKESEFKIYWNGCACNTIGVILKDDFKIKEDPRPCVCEKIWAENFAKYAENELNKKSSE